MSIQLTATNGNTYVGLHGDEVITQFDNPTPDNNLWNHTTYPSTQDMVDHATGDPWIRLGNTGPVWRGATGSDQLFMAAVQAYHARIRRSPSREGTHPMSLEWDTLIDMAVLDNRDPPPPVLKQAFRHSAGLATNLLEALDEHAKCHRMLADNVTEWKGKTKSDMEKLKRRLVDEEQKV